MFVNEALVKRMKDTYKPGTRIMLDCMGEDRKSVV